VNSVNVVGRLTHDPEYSVAKGDRPVCRMRIAIPRARWRDGEDRGAVFITVACFDAQATASSRALKKGARIGVAGRLEYHEWKAEDGSARSRHEIVGESVEFLDPPPEVNEPARSEGPGPRGAAAEIPF
jgi:single-strand DNA-binding protein